MKPPEPVLPTTITTGTTGKIEAWNADCKKLLGYPEQEVLHAPLTRLFAPSFHAEIRKRLEARSNTAERIEADLLRQNGSSLRTQLTLISRFTSAHVFKGHLLIIDSPAIWNPSLEDERVRKFAESLPGIFYAIDHTGHLVFWNRRLEFVSGLSPAEIRAAHATDFFDKHDKLLVAQKLRDTFEYGAATLEATLVLRDGTRIPYLFQDARTDIDGNTFVCGMGLDISERKKHEETLYLYERALHASRDAIVITRSDGAENPIVYVNPAYENLTGYSKQEIIGTDPRFMHAPGLEEEERARLREAIREHRDTQVVFRNRKKNGKLFWNQLQIAPVSTADGTVSHFIGVMTDVTRIREYQAQLEHEANHDPLTNLANRTLLRDRLEQGVSFARRHHRIVATAFIDLDNFKAINDNLGHSVGDAVLKTVAARIKSCVRETDTVARVGGDEFVLILVDEPDGGHVADLIDRIRESIAQPIPIDDHELRVGASIGISIFPSDGDSPQALMHAADVAMYHAKTSGRNNCQFFSAELNAAAHDRLELAARLRDAIENGELYLAYLPIVDLKSARIVGAEALVRWNHPSLGLLLPKSFIPIAEETGLIVALGKWTLDRACALLKHFNVLGFQDFTVSLNLSSRQFRQKNFASQVVQTLSAAGVPIARLGLEITELLLLKNPDYASRILAELKEAGIGMSIDDFGIGASSLQTLKDFPVDHIKIDRSFVDRVVRGGDEAMIARAVISLGHSLNMTVIAEGVETIEQLEFLRAYQCDQIQGNYFSAPITQAGLQALMEAKTMLRFR